MSVSGIASTSLSQLGAPALTPTSRRQSEDLVGREFEQDLQNGDLAGAQQAYAQLAAFGANNSGPFTQANMQTEFQTMGTDLQSGNLAAAEADNSTLTGNLLTNDARTAHQDQVNGNMQGYQNAMSNLKADYWAVYGQQFDSNNVQSLPNGLGGTAVSVQA
jgi:hypothetical protein